MPVLRDLRARIEKVPTAGDLMRDGDGPETIERKMGAREIARLDRAARRHEFGRPEITELEIGSTTHRVAEVEPMDVDGVTIVGRSKISARVSSVSRYSGEEAYPREEENCVPKRSTASCTAALSRGCISSPR